MKTKELLEHADFLETLLPTEEYDYLNPYCCIAGWALRRARISWSVDPYTGYLSFREALAKLFDLTPTQVTDLAFNPRYFGGSAVRDPGLAAQRLRRWVQEQDPAGYDFFTLEEVSPSEEPILV